MLEYTTYTKHDVDSHTMQLKPGNFLVTHGNDFFDLLIHIFTFSKWNHSALIISSDGTILELVTSGIRKRHISEYQSKDIYIVDIDMSDEDRKQAVEYAHYMLKKHTTYGFLTIASIAFKIITMSRLVIKFDGTLICSEFVARALAQGGIIWDKDPSLLTPADLYNRFARRHS